MRRKNTWLIIPVYALVVSCGGEPPETTSSESDADADAGGRATIQAVRSSTIPEKTAGGSESGATPRNSSVRDLPDPAMEVSPSSDFVAGGDGIAFVEADSETAAPEEPTAFTIDAENARAYLPGTGWTTMENFWDIYYNRPEELPGDLDHEAIHRIRPDHR